MTEHAGDVQFNPPVIGICRTHRHNTAVDQLAQVVVRHLGEFVAGDQSLVFAGGMCSGHAVTPPSQTISIVHGSSVMNTLGVTLRVQAASEGRSSVLSTTALARRHRRNQILSVDS